jgi:YVTN family beta-propeller protein
MRRVSLLIGALVCSAPALAQPFAYVASDVAGAIFVVDSATSQRVASISLPSGTQVSALVVSNDGTRVYAASSEADSVVVVNAQTNTVAGTIAVGRGPAGLALTPNGATLYVANSSEATISEASTSSTSAGRGQLIGSLPNGVALSSDGTKLYVSHGSSTGTISVVSTSSLLAPTTFTLSRALRGIAVNSADTRLFTISADGTLSLLDASTGTVATHRAVGAPGATQLTGVAVTPDGAKVLVTDALAGTVTIVDASNGQILSTLTTVGTPQSVAINPAGTYAYVVGRGDAALTVIDLATNTVASTLALPAKGERVAFARTTPTAATPQSGWWWNPSESGRGFSFETSGSRMFFAYYLYASDGTATWYLGNGSTASGYVASLDQYAGGQTLAGSFRAASLRGSSGQSRAVFFSSSYGALVWPGGTTPIQRFDIVTGGAAAGPASGMPETGWWWNPSEPGRGFFIEVQASTMFLATFLYDDRGEPVWYTSQNAMTSTSLYTGTLTEYANGQTLTGSYRAPTTTGSRGAISITFSSRTAGTLTLPNGTSIPIQRFSF